MSHAALDAYETKQSEWSAYYASDKAWEYRADTVKTVDRWVLGDRNPFHPDVDEGCPRTIARAVWVPVWKHEREVTE